MQKRIYYWFFLAFLGFFSSCGPENRKGWVEMPVPNEFGEDTGKIYLQVYGFDLSPGLDEAVITFNTIMDYIADAELTIFTITLNGKSSSNDVIVTTPDGREVLFPCYDGIIFNVDAEGDDLDRMIELMKYDELIFQQDGYKFKISTKGFKDIRVANNGANTMSMRLSASQ